MDISPEELAALDQIAYQIHLETFNKGSRVTVSLEPDEMVAIRIADFVRVRTEILEAIKGAPE